MTEGSNDILCNDMSILFDAARTVCHITLPEVEGLDASDALKLAQLLFVKGISHLVIRIGTELVSFYPINDHLRLPCIIIDFSLPVTAGIGHYCFDTIGFDVDTSSFVVYDVTKHGKLLGGGVDDDDDNQLSTPQPTVIAVNSSTTSVQPTQILPSTTANLAQSLLQLLLQTTMNRVNLSPLLNEDHLTKLANISLLLSQTGEHLATSLLSSAQKEKVDAERLRTDAETRKLNSSAELAEKALANYGKPKSSSAIINTVNKPYTPPTHSGSSAVGVWNQPTFNRCHINSLLCLLLRYCTVHDALKVAVDALAPVPSVVAPVQTQALPAVASAAEGTVTAPAVKIETIDIDALKNSVLRESLNFSVELRDSKNIGLNLDGTRLLAALVDFARVTTPHYCINNSQECCFATYTHWFNAMPLNVQSIFLFDFVQETKATSICIAEDSHDNIIPRKHENAPIKSSSHVFLVEPKNAGAIQYDLSNDKRECPARENINTNVSRLKKILEGINKNDSPDQYENAVKEYEEAVNKAKVHFYKATDTFNLNVGGANDKTPQLIVQQSE